MDSTVGSLSRVSRWATLRGDRSLSQTFRQALTSSPLCPEWNSWRWRRGDVQVSPEVGEQLVGAYLKVVEGCDVISCNVRPRRRPSGSRRTGRLRDD